MENIIRNAEKDFLNNKDYVFNVGDTVSVALKIQEGNKTRIQNYQGVVIQKRGIGLGASFSVRKASGSNVYVERIFPLHSPLVSDIKVVRKGNVRRAKLFYLRKRTGKATRIQEKQ